MPIPGATVIELRAVSHPTAAGSSLAEIQLAIPAGAVTLLRGEPDSGARELLRLIGLMEAPAAGEALVEGVSTAGWTDEQRAEFRAGRLGFLLAAPFLLPALTVIENVAMPIFKRLPEITPEEAGLRAGALLAFAGMAENDARPAGDLSLIEQHRVAIARALANEPAALLVEELDGLLSGDALAQVLALLRHAAVEKGVAVVATVSARFPAALGLRVLDVAQGRVQLEAAAPLN
jgi:ABC-type lipoprotein export system ATPase subunit